MIITFYEENIKNQSVSAQNISDVEELAILHILAVLLQENIVFKNDTSKYRALKKNMNDLIKTYSRKLFDPIIRIPEFVKFILILKEAGALTQMIDSYPTLSRSRDAYQMKIDQIIQNHNN